MDEIYTKLRHNLPSICEIEIKRKNISPSCSKSEIVPYLYLLINCVNVCFVHFHHVHYLFLVCGRHFLNHMVIFFVLCGVPLAQFPRQPPSSPNGSVGSVCVVCYVTIIEFSYSHTVSYTYTNPLLQKTFSPGA